MTKVAKNKATKVSTTIPETNSNTNALSQTPIEIALKIDKNGLTSLKNLYSFLELDPKNFLGGVKETFLIIRLLLNVLTIFPFVKRKND